MHARSVLSRALLLALSASSSTLTAQAAPCSSGGHGAFDFWIGSWEVRGTDGSLAGHSRVQSLMNGCVLHEYYTTPAGYEGESLNIYDETRGVWHQTWVDNAGALLVLEGGMQADRMVMEGSTVDAQGSVTLNRITWSVVGGVDAQVRQFWETSTDDGETWSGIFDGTYIRLNSPPEWDVLIVGGAVIDGSGGRPYLADIAIVGDRIAEISTVPLDRTLAVRLIDATNLAVSPGFVDLHAHLDPILRLPGAESHVRQGVTTALGGPDGGGPWPLAEHLEAIEQLGVGMNVGFLVGHNRLRREVMGLENRPPTADELAGMQQMVVQAMDEGAWGISTGLKYLPGAFSDVDEVVALAATAARLDGFYTSHLREEGLGLLESVGEALEIGRRASIPVVLTHHKVVGAPMWGSSRQTLAMVDSARAAGTDVMMDQYPYTAGHTGITVLVPAWAMSGGTDSLLSRMDDPVLADSILDGIEFNIINDRGANDLSRIQFAAVPWDPTLEGLTLMDFAGREGVEPTPANGARLVIEILRRGGANGIFHAMNEADVQAIMAHPFTAIASDGRLTEPGSGHPHPRWYGTFPRVLGLYARDLGVISVVDAVRKMTSLPARRMGLVERGEVRQGWYADLVVFNPALVADQATFIDPHQYPIGIPWVIVNGQVAVEAGEYRDVRSGRVLRSPGGS